MGVQDPGWLTHQIVEQAPDAIIVADRDGAIRLWNGGAHAIFGYPAQEAVGQSLDLIIPERFRDRHWNGYRKAMETGVTRYGRELLAVPAIRKDGTRISVEFSIAMLRDPAGQVLAVTAIMRDVTQRWTQQQELQHRLADLEARAATARPD
jgi:PAS domain S-box-containing protein